MAEDTDFAALYGELGITSDLTPEQFRHAYRRRVAQLHPDQRGGPGDVARLQELNRTYAAALAFLRTHGRLPGAPVAARVAAPAPPSDAPGTTHAPDPAAAPAPAATTPGAPPARAKAGTGAASRWFTWMAVVAVAVLLVHACGERAPPGTPPVATTFDTAVEDALGIDKVRLGMDKARVEAIQGKPGIRLRTRWDYGPSWVAFKCGGAVSDWYSAPQRPLRVDTPHPTTDEWERYDAAPPRGC